MIKSIFPFNDFLYLLQLEEYDSARYAKLLPRFFFRRNLQIRDTLKNTQRIQQMRIVSILLTLALATPPFILHPSSFFSLLIPVLLLLLIPVVVLLTNLLMTPWYEYLKSNKEKKAAQIIKERNDLKIIAITGSYGKTTTKTALYELLKNDYRVQYTPGNINTPTGIAQWIIDKLQPNTQIVIIEMDAYTRGEIARSCAITPPDIALITNFGDQHLERFGSHENLTLGYLEAFIKAKSSATLLLSEEEYNKAMMHESAQSILTNLKGKTIQQFNKLSPSDNIPSSFFLLPLSFQQNIQNAKIIAEKLGISAETISLVIHKIQPPDRRGDIKVIDGYTVIDRSYNISESTAKQGIIEASHLAKQQGKDLVVITAGIPERGEESEEVNKKYGQFIKEYAKYIIMLQSIHASAIEMGIDDPKKVYRAKHMHEALVTAKSLGTPNNFLILMLPELTDLSY